MRKLAATICLPMLGVCACMHAAAGFAPAPGSAEPPGAAVVPVAAAAPAAAVAPVAATFAVPDAALPKPLVLVAYGDMRFTDAVETQASNPAARRALVAKVAAEEPAAVFLSGDLTWHGVAADYAVYRDETARWRDQNLRVYPALGNHEFSQCEAQDCLSLWWSAFPELQGHRWYSVSLGRRVLVVALDSNAPLLPGSEQRVWLETQMAALDRGVQVVFFVLHHPPVADLQTEKLPDHNPRPNEQSLADFLDSIAGRNRARFIVTAGHIHNYERLERAGIVYLVSGGGGAKPYEVERTPADLYRNTEFPNYHYVRFELGAKRLTGEMIRLADSAAAVPGRWKVRDRFELTLPP